jgi:hypothetical protein
VDQRLGQREAQAFRTHLLVCRTCRKAFDSCRELQTMTRALPVHEVSTDFQANLFERISAGEGARPEILRGPVALSHRIKLFASGAVTAAALLLSLGLIIDEFNKGQPVTKNPASTRSASNSGLGGLERVSLPIPRPIDPVSFGRNSVENCVHQVVELQEAAPRYRRMQPNQAFRALQSKSQQTLLSVQVVNMLDGRVVVLPTKLRTGLVSIEKNLERVVRSARGRSYSRRDIERMVTLIEAARMDRRGAEGVQIRNLRVLDLTSHLPPQLQRQPNLLRELSDMFRLIAGPTASWAPAGENLLQRHTRLGERVLLIGATAEGGWELRIPNEVRTKKPGHSK